MTYDFWALPGGQLNLLESSPNALRLERKEETNLRLEVGRLLQFAENLSTSVGFIAGQRFRELGLYGQMTLSEATSQNDVRSEIMCREGSMPIVNRWFPILQLAAVQLYPAFLRSAPAGLPEHTVHVNRTDPVSA